MISKISAAGGEIKNLPLVEIKSRQRQKCRMN